MGSARAHSWRTHSCVPCSHSCEHLLSRGWRRSHECERGTQECVRHNHTIINRMRLAIGLTLWLVTAYAASVWDGVYTAGQADRGKALYGKQCASCHGAGLDGSGQAPPLT